MTVAFKGKTIKCGNEHSLFYEEPPELAVRQFFSWAQRGVVEIFGGQAGRPIAIDCWVHDRSFNNLTAIDKYLGELDKLAGEFGELSITTTAGGGTSKLIRKNCRFIGFKRKPFNGQEWPSPLPAIGPDTSTYGYWHIAGELHFYQLIVSEK